MKKIISLILSFAMVFCLVSMLTACGETKIGVQGGTTGQYFVDGDEDWGFDGLNGYVGAPYNNGGLAVSSMKNGQVKYVILDQAPALQLEKKIDGIKVIDIPLTEEVYAFGVDKNQPELLAAINATLATLKATGALDVIIAAYAEGNGEAFESAVYDPNRPDEQLVVATNAEFAPFEYKEGDKFAGIDMAIAKMVATALGLELVIRDMEFEAVVTSVGKNGVDVAMAGLTVNEEREQMVNFSVDYYNAAQVLIVLDDCTDFDDCTTAEQVIAKLEELR